MIRPSTSPTRQSTSGSNPEGWASQLSHSSGDSRSSMPSASHARLCISDSDEQIVGQAQPPEAEARDVRRLRRQLLQLAIGPDHAAVSIGLR